MKKTKTLAIVLRRTDYGEADRIVDFLTPSGRVAVLAKGVRKPKSKMAGGIEVFSINEIVFLEGKSELRTLISARNAEFYAEIMKDYDRTEVAYWAIKQVARASELIEAGEFFEILKKTFMALNDFEIDHNLVRAWLGLNLALVRGESFNFETSTSGQRLMADKKYDFDNFEKSFVEGPHGKFGAEHIKFLRLLVSSEPKILSKIIGWREIFNQIYEIIQILTEN